MRKKKSEKTGRLDRSTADPITLVLSLSVSSALAYSITAKAHRLLSVLSEMHLFEQLASC